MKKFMLMIGILIFPLVVKAERLTTKVDCPEKAKVGEEFNCTIGVTASDFKAASGNLNLTVENGTLVSFTPSSGVDAGSGISEAGYLTLITDEFTGYKEFGTVKIKLNERGTVNVNLKEISVANNETDTDVDASDVSKSVSILSNENYLEEFSFVNSDISFDKNTTTYNITVPNNIKVLTTSYVDKTDDSNDCDNDLKNIGSSYSLMMDASSISESNKAKITWEFNGSSEFDLEDDSEKAIEECTDNMDESKETYECYYQDMKIAWSKYNTEEKTICTWVNVPIANLNVGDNVLKITVTSEYGEDRTYTFNITRQGSGSSQIVENNPTEVPKTGSTTIIIISILLVISLGVCVYLIYRNNKKSKIDILYGENKK